MDARVTVAQITAARITSIAVLLSTFALVNAAALLTTASTVFAQEQPLQKPLDRAVDIRVARLVSNLGSPSYTTRRAADEELTNIGAAAREQIEAASQSDDPEVRVRARRLLHQLKFAALWQATPIDLDVTDAPADEVVAAIRQQTGNHLFAGDKYGAFHGGKVSLRSGDQTFWKVVDQICRQTQNRIQPRHGSGLSRWILVAGDRGDYPVAYAGPVRARINSARRCFVEDFKYRDTKSEVSRSLQLNLQLSWEDRFRLVAYRSQLEVATAVDDKGGRTTGEVVLDDDWSVFEGGHKQLAMAVRFLPPTTSATRFETLTLRWPVIAVGDMAVLETDDMKIDRVYQQDDARLVIERIRQRGGDWNITVSVSRDLAVPEPREILFLENEFELIDDQGTSCSVDRTVKLGLTASTARVKLTFATNSPGRKAAKLRMRFPRIRDQKDLMITFRNVPLPTALLK